MSQNQELSEDRESSISKKLVESGVGGLGGGDLPDAFFGCFGCVECVECVGWFVLFCCLAYLCF